MKNLLFFGVDIHILELRGHGKSSIALQRERAQRFGRPLPPDLDYGWDIDSYFLYDLPAAVSAVKRITRREKIFYCGHSMGGMLGYGYAGIHDDFEGLITIGSPADLGRGFFAAQGAGPSARRLWRPGGRCAGRAQRCRAGGAPGPLAAGRGAQVVSRGWASGSSPGGPASRRLPLRARGRLAEVRWRSSSRAPRSTPSTSGSPRA